MIQKPNRKRWPRKPRNWKVLTHDRDGIPTKEALRDMHWSARKKVLPEGWKFCTCCERVLSTRNFSKVRGRPGSKCKQCRMDSQRKSHSEDPVYAIYRNWVQNCWNRHATRGDDDPGATIATFEEMRDIFEEVHERKTNGEQVEVHHLISIRSGGGSNVQNLIIVTPDQNAQYHADEIAFERQCGFKMSDIWALILDDVINVNTKENGQ